MWGSFKVQNTLRYVKLYIFVHMKPSDGECMTIPKNQICAKSDFCDFQDNLL